MAPYICVVVAERVSTCFKNHTSREGQAYNSLAHSILIQRVAIDAVKIGAPHFLAFHCACSASHASACLKHCDLHFADHVRQGTDQRAEP